MCSFKFSVRRIITESGAVIPRLHDQAGSTSWLDELAIWASQLDVGSMLAGCLLDVCSMFARSCKRVISLHYTVEEPW